MKSVECGAAFLDEHVPGWEDSIDLKRLDLGDGSRCILGQIYLSEHPRVTKRFEAYTRKAIELGLGDPDAPIYADPRKTGPLGFMQRGRNTYASLTAAWKKLILERRERQPS